MPDNWIGTSILTDEEDITIDGVKAHDLLEQNDFGGDLIEVNGELHPVLFEKLGGATGDTIYLTNMTPPTGSTKRYKTIADAT